VFLISGTMSGNSSEPKIANNWSRDMKGYSNVSSSILILCIKSTASLRKTVDSFAPPPIDGTLGTILNALYRASVQAIILSAD